ncbi:MAG: CDP-glycerol glycerophosphotransferase family protein [Thermoguttaceae bacterium]|jgi:hypothetical protein|nr:CDP-glycerol glycerophosphotransferase family protein [Thermoguttaceae bacterium]
MLSAKLRGKKTLTLRFNAATQFMHLAPVIAKLRDHGALDRISLSILTNPAEIPAMHRKLAGLGLAAPVHSDRCSRFLLFCDGVLSVDQGVVYPYLGCRMRACSFHGQPSKGNTYHSFNYRQINTLFFYGPLMRDYYLEAKKANPSWPDIACYDVGQPLSDRLFNERPDRLTARRRLGLEPSCFTVVYAPSFEYCSSLATHGTRIIDALLHLGVNLVVKPHPAFYNTAKCANAFNQHVPNIREWREQVRRYDGHSRCVFREDDSLDAILAIGAADVMLTDYSGIAFDGILLDLGMVYWDCPLLYSEYLPECYGVDGEAARRDLACNVGRDAGIVVHDCAELADAIATYREDSSHKAKDRDIVRQRLLCNPGIAAATMAHAVEQLIGVNAID